MTIRTAVIRQTEHRMGPRHFVPRALPINEQVIETTMLKDSKACNQLPAQIVLDTGSAKYISFNRLIENMKGKTLIRSLVILALVCVAVALRGSQAQKAQGHPSFEKAVLPFVVENCYACHNERRKSGELNLEQFKTAASMNKER